jgi:hypothetical protein
MHDRGKWAVYFDAGERILAYRTKNAQTQEEERSRMRLRTLFEKASLRLR